MELGKGLHVLVVDDDILTRKLMERSLARMGCAVDTAENGQVALDMLRAPGGAVVSQLLLGSQSPLAKQSNVSSKRLLCVFELCVFGVRVLLCSVMCRCSAAVDSFL